MFMLFNRVSQTGAILVSWGRKLEKGQKGGTGTKNEFWAILKLNFETYTRYSRMVDKKQKKKKKKEKRQRV